MGHNLTHSAIEFEDVCVAWRKGLRRVWDLSALAHYKFVTLYAYVKFGDPSSIDFRDIVRKKQTARQKEVKPYPETVVGMAAWVNIITE